MTLKEFILNNSNETVDEYRARVRKFILDIIEKSLKLADQYGIDRNDVLRMVSTLFYDTVQVANYEQYELENNNN